MRGDRIAGVGGFAALCERFPGSPAVDLGDALLLPAAVNSHTHLELSGLHDAIPAGLSFVDWVIALVRARRPLTPEQLEGAARSGVSALRAAGTAAVGEISTFGASVRPLVESGLRGVVYHELLGVDPAEAPELLCRGQEQIRRSREEHPGARVRFGLSLHTPFTVSPELLAQVARWCRDEAVPLSIHVAESPAEAAWMRDGSGPIAETLYPTARWPARATAPGCSPVEYLERLGVLEARPLAIHGVQVSHDDLALLAQRGVPVAHCPRSNAQLLVGRMPYAAYRAASIPLSLGTDSLASSPSLSVWEELSACWSAHRAAGETPDAEELLHHATLGGAAALGLDDEIGSLAEGKAAELALARLDPLPARERDDGDAVLQALMEGRLSVAGLAMDGYGRAL